MSLTLTPFAQETLQSAFEFMESSSPQNAEKVLVRILDLFALLEQRKFIGSNGPISGMRRFLVPRTPFFVVYRVIADCDVEVLAVLHKKQVWPKIPIPS